MKKSILLLLLLVSLQAIAEVFVQSSDRILVVAPHPDDEILGASGILHQVSERIRNGEKTDIRVLIMTCGDGYSSALKKLQASGVHNDLDGDGDVDYVDLGITRKEESLKALAQLGISQNKVIFLGLPDGGLKSLYEKSDIYYSPFTKTRYIPYSFAKSSGKPQQRETVMDDLREIIRDFKPSKVFTPTLSDHHPDHYTTRNFLKLALQKEYFNGRHLEYLIHWGRYHRGWPGPDVFWPNEIANHRAPDYELFFSTINWSQKEKSDLIGVYKSQVAVDAWYLYPFAKESEVFWQSRASREDYLK